MSNENIQQKENTQISEINLPKYNRTRTFISIAKNFISPKWEHISHLKNLSNLTESEINNLPSNDIVTRLFTAVMRTWQKDFRSYFIGTSESKKSQTRKEQSIKLTKNKKETSFVIYTPDNENPLPCKTMLDDFMNPFNKKGEKIYGTEYAQLVNIAARQARKKRLISKIDVLKLTLLASIQLPPGINPRGMKIMSNKFIRGERVDNEIEKVSNDINFLQLVPLTQERINDPEFVKAIPLVKLLTHSGVKEATKKAILGLLSGK